MTAIKTTPEPWTHQKEAMAFLRDKNAAMLAMDMGTGKTACAIALMDEIEAQKTLVLCPLSVVDGVWPDQVSIHGKREMTIIPLGTRAGSVKTKHDKGQKGLDLAHARHEPAIVIVNYDSAFRPPLSTWLLNENWDLLVMDESHRIKNPTGAASTFASKLSLRIRKKLALTGTPMPHSPLDIWAQYRALNASIYGTSFTNFRSRYAVFEEKEFAKKEGSEIKLEKRNIVSDHQNLPELHEKFYSIAFRVSAEDVLDLPPAIETYARVHLCPKAISIYTKLEDELQAEITQGKVVNAANALSKLLRFQQITSGFAVPEDGTDPITVDTAKANALRDIIDGLPADEPLVVFARFQRDLDTIAKTAEDAGRPHFEISGRLKQLPEWNKSGGLLGVQIQAGGLGLDLTKARYAVYYSLGFSLGDYQQTLARLHRPGQQGIVDYIHLVAAGTVDERIIEALEKKSNVVEHILKGYANTQPLLETIEEEPE